MLEFVENLCLNVLFFKISRFPEGSLYTNTNDEGWRMIRVGDDPLGFGQFFFFFILI